MLLPDLPADRRLDQERDGRPYAPPRPGDVRPGARRPCSSTSRPRSRNRSARFQGIYQVVLDIAEKENALRRLLREIEKTKRRASAIENVLVPRLEGIVRYIKFRFDEMERDAFSMLKTVKRKMEQEAENVAAA